MLFESIEAGLMGWLVPGGSALAAVLLTFLAYRLALVVTRHFTVSTIVVRQFLDAASGPLGAFLCLLAFNSMLRTVPGDLPMLEGVQRVTTLLVILSLTWAAVRCSSAIGDMIVGLNPVVGEQWLRARRVETQTRFLVRALNVLIVIVGLGAALMTFDSVRQIGASLLASAGIGGIILGFAARPVLGNMLAGMQIALTQPFRIDDVLNVQGEWCWVEEVTATYVVLRVWDLRRLIVPLQWFIENPFQNWSRSTAELIGPVFLWVDYAMPLEPLRAEFGRLLRQAAHWNGKTESVQVVEASDRALQVRFLMSAPDSTRLWELRCAMREQLVTFMQTHYPAHLPRLRAQMLARADPDGPGSLAADPGTST